MNERINELATQAGFIRFSPKEDPNTPIDWSSDYTAELNRFAELIVQECIDVLKRPDVVMTTNKMKLSEYNQGWVNGRKLAIEHLERYFEIR
jgi:hypothetical protein